MKIRIIFLGLFIFSILVFGAHFFIVGKAVYGDGRYYYSYLPAFLVQHTLNFSQTFKHTDIPTWFFTPLGYPANVYPIGPAIFWAFPYLLSFGVGSFLGQNQYATWYQVPIGITVIALGIIGLWITSKFLNQFFTKRNTLITILTLFFATNLLFYGSIDVLNSHIVTFFLSSLLLFIWLKRPSIVTSLLQGILIGFLMLVRSQEALFLLLPLSSLVITKNKTLLLAFPTSLLVFFPQMFLWHLIWGNWLINPYLHVAAFHFLSPNIWGVLFNHESGLFLWTPITMFASLGLILFAKEKPKLGIPMLLVFLGELYIIGSWSIWWEGASYSARMFVSSLPFLGIGLAYLYEKKLFQKLKYFFLVFFSLLNVSLIFYFLLKH